MTQLSFDFSNLNKNARIEAQASLATTHKDGAPPGVDPEELAIVKNKRDENFENISMRFDFLQEPLLTVRGHGPERPSLRALPEVLAALVSDEVVSFERLQAHQRQPWYCFLVQLAVLAMRRAGQGSLPSDPETWRELLLGLTGGAHEPWCLYVRDILKPALLQPPVPEGSLEKYNKEARTPDELDYLVTAKNHDVKSCRVLAPDPEHWLFALVTLQTMDGYAGATVYGIARMNGGYGSRPFVGLAPGYGWGARFGRDVAAFLEQHDALRERLETCAGAVELMWLLPWDGAAASALPWSRCDPAAIEVARRVRFELEGWALRARRAGTTTTRVADAKERKGLTGDFWMPIVTDKEPKALTLGEAGYSYERAAALVLGIDPDLQPSPAQAYRQRAEISSPMLAWMTCVPRGEGQTQGFHERVLHIPARVGRWSAGTINDPQRQHLASRARDRVNDAAIARGNILRPALLSLLQAGDSHKASARLTSYADEWTRALDREVDQYFFEDLWGSLEDTNPQAQRAWRQRLVDLARAQLSSAILHIPTPSMRRYRAISAAEARFEALARRHFDDLFAPSPGADQTQGPTT
jgi:CRISPR system Cascade subunit CasA